MKSYNTPEYNPNNAVLPSNDFFSFLDGELYYIALIKDSLYSKYIKINKENYYLSFEETDISAFRFEWTGNGYHLLSAADPELALTVHLSSIDNSYYVSLEPSANLNNQLWDIVPYNSGSTTPGISILTAFEYENCFLYLAEKNNKVSVSRNYTENTSLMLCSLSEDWITFGMACMQYLGWIYVTEKDAAKSIENYYTNMLTGLSQENILIYGNTPIIVNQSGGNFNKLTYGDTYMRGVACETIAVCNAIRIINGTGDPYGSDLFKITAEFELSGLYDNSFKKLIVKTGSALGIKKIRSIGTENGSMGGDPDKIKNCLEAHGISFKQVHVNDKPVFMKKNQKSEESMKEFDNELKNARCAIVSYNFSTLHQAIHTFACLPSGNDKIQTFNRFSNHDLKNNYLNESADNKTRELYPSCSKALAETNDSRFYSGYLIY